MYDFVSPENGFLAYKVNAKTLKEGEVLAYLAVTQEEVQVVSDLARAENTVEEEPLEEEVEKKESEVERLLEELGLLRYAEVLEEEGYDSLAAVETLTSEDLKEMGLKKGHRKVLLSRLEKEEEEVV